MRQQGSVLVPGTCGELVQGTICGTNFLVSCPVNWFSRVTIIAAPGQRRIAFPADRIKTARAVRRALQREGGAGLAAVIEVSSGLPIGKGMASSTADLSARGGLR